MMEENYEEGFFFFSNFESDSDDGDDAKEFKDDSQQFIAMEDDVGVSNFSLERLPFFQVSPVQNDKVHTFTLASKELMITCLVAGEFPFYQRIKEADPSFKPKNKSHGRVVEIHDEIATCKRWNDIQSMVEVNIDVNGKPSLFHKIEVFNKEVSCTEEWSKFCF